MKRIPFINDTSHQRDLIGGKYRVRSNEAMQALYQAGLSWENLFNIPWGTHAIAIYHNHNWHVLPIVSVIWSEPNCQGEPIEYEVTEASDIPGMIENLLKGERS